MPLSPLSVQVKGSLMSYKPRVIKTTDLRVDTDDEQSIVR